jgi:hypothetical protein
MSMSKQDFIALADAVEQHNIIVENEGLGTIPTFRIEHLYILADFCKLQNPNFNRSRWLNYIAGKVGPDGGKVKP